MTELPLSMPNADQSRLMPLKILALISMSINADQCQSMPDQVELIRHSSALPINAGSILPDQFWH